MDGQPTWTDCNEAGDYVVPNVLSPRDLVFRPDNMDETVPDTDSPYLSRYKKYNRHAVCAWCTCVSTLFVKSRCTYLSKSFIIMVSKTKIPYLFFVVYCRKDI